MARLSRVPAAIMVCAAMLCSAWPLAARELHWRQLKVTARLDAEGRLHVREEHTMVFDESWNGGERRFLMFSGQELVLHSIERKDEAGSFRQLTRGQLDRIDHWDWHDSSTVRWRSRAEGSPWFDSEELVYALDYTLSNILYPENEF